MSIYADYEANESKCANDSRRIAPTEGMGWDSGYGSDPILTVGSQRVGGSVC